MYILPSDLSYICDKTLATTEKTFLTSYQPRFILHFSSIYYLNIQRKSLFNISIEKWKVALLPSIVISLIYNHYYNTQTNSSSKIYSSLYTFLLCDVWLSLKNIIYIGFFKKKNSTYTLTYTFPIHKEITITRIINTQSLILLILYYIIKHKEETGMRCQLNINVKQSKRHIMTVKQM